MGGEENLQKRARGQRKKQSRQEGMLNLFSVKPKTENPDAKPEVKISAAELRLQKDMQELSLGSNTSISFPEGKDNLLAFDITLKPEEGFWKGGAFNFTFRVTNEYLHKPLKVHCETKIYHPNIDLDGNVC